MRAFCDCLANRSIWLTAFLFLAAAVASAQSKPVLQTIFRDSNSNLISNNEFVDIRMANFHYPDATVVKTLEDGTIEFRLQKIPQEGMKAPEFKLRTIGGKALSLESLHGKVVVLNFWFIGCGACRAQKPRLNELRTKFANSDDVIFLAVTADDAGAVKKYLAREPFDYLQAADAERELDRFRFSGYPKNIVIAGTGEIVYWRSTITAWDKFESVIRGELEKASK
ncbi:MAG: TlpA disulfide reductase family protein [Pyrinomonadaceae bacterium]